MKWMRLKVILIPLIMQEVDNVTERYISTYVINKISSINTEMKEIQIAILSFLT